MNDEKNDKKIKEVFKISGESKFGSLGTTLILNGPKPKKSTLELMGESTIDLKKPGIIIAVYPGMGQEVYSKFYDNYFHLESYPYYTKKMPRGKSQGMMYALDAINKVQQEDYDICFVDAHTDVLNYLKGLNQDFIIFYPTPTQKKEVVLERIARIYSNRMSLYSAGLLVYVTKNHVKKINDLRMYPNSIASSKGILNEELLLEISRATPLERRKIIEVFSEMKKTTNIVPPKDPKKEV